MWDLMQMIYEQEWRDSVVVGLSMFEEKGNIQDGGNYRWIKHHIL